MLRPWTKPRVSKTLLASLWKKSSSSPPQPKNLNRAVVRKICWQIILCVKNPLENPSTVSNWLADMAITPPAWVENIWRLGGGLESPRKMINVRPSISATQSTSGFMLLRFILLLIQNSKDSTFFWFSNIKILSFNDSIFSPSPDTVAESETGQDELIWKILNPIWYFHNRPSSNILRGFGIYLLADT